MTKSYKTYLRFINVNFIISLKLTNNNNLTISNLLSKYLAKSSGA